MTRIIKSVLWQSKLVQMPEFTAVIEAIQATLTGEFGNVWPEAREIQLVPCTGAYQGEEAVWHVDNIQGASFLGEHLPNDQGIVLIQPSMGMPGGWSATSCHEHQEQAVDRFCNRCYQAPWLNYSAAMLAAETNDPVENDIYKGQGGIELSNFVTPDWFIPGSVGPWDHMNQLHGPLIMTAGGYQSYFANGRWSQSFARHHAKVRHPFDRLSRRSRLGA